MKRIRWLATTVSLAVFAGAVYLLLTASPWLEVTAVESIGLPLGNLIAWAGMLALPTAVYLGFVSLLDGRSRFMRLCSVSLRAAWLLAAAWGIVCYGLAGNWAFNFSGVEDGFRGSAAAAGLFRSYSLGVVVLSLLIAALLFLARLARALRADGKQA